VPTPFYHLSVAEDMLEHPRLMPSVRRVLDQELPAFLFGQVAPDVQVISGQKRESTHFYSLPARPEAVPPWERILQYYPELNCDPAKPQKCAFIAGYLCHLQADWFWSGRIFEPYFGPRANWKDFRERLYLHNVLRAYLDFGVLQTLNGEVRTGLSRATLQDWLPFVEKHHLQTWRDFLADQLKPGAAIQTVEVFAARQGISVEAYYQLIQADDEMQRQIFDFLPRQCLDDYHAMLINANLALMNDYLVAMEGDLNAHN
jgi:hypothetical protein